MIAESTIVRIQLDDPATDVFSGLPFDDGSYVAPTTEEKAAAFKAWAEGLNPIEQASIYAGIASAAPLFVVYVFAAELYFSLLFVFGL